MNTGGYAKAFVAVATVGEVFIQTQWPHGKYTVAAMAAIGAALVYLVPNVAKVQQIQTFGTRPIRDRHNPEYETEANQAELETLGDDTAVIDG